MKSGIYASLALGLVLLLYQYPDYPREVANHFGAGGIPNGWMSNTAHVAIGMAVLVINSAIFLSVPWIFRKVPVRYISFPKKHYWLAPERKERSIGVMSNWLMFFGLVTNLFLIAVFHLVYQANQHQPPRLDETAFLLLISGYTLILMMWLIALFARFARTGPHPGR